MATVIDELVVRMGLDIKDLQKGMKQVQSDLDKTRKESETTAKHMQETGKKAAEFFNQVRNSALAFFAVLTAGRGLATFTRDVVSSGAALNRLATNLNESVTTLSAWGNMSKQSGGSAGEFEGTIRNLSQAAWDLAHTGKSQVAPFLQQFGMDLLDSNKKMRPLNDLFLDIGDKLKSVGDRQSAMHWAQILGIDEGTFNLLMKSRPELERMLKWQQQHAALTKKQGDEAQAAQEKWEAFKQELEGKMRPVVMKMLDLFQKMMPAITRLAEVAAPIIETLTQIFINLDNATDGVSTKIVILIGLFRLLGGGAILSGLAGVAGRIAGIGTAAGTAASGGLAAMLGALSRIAGVAALAFHSEELNKGENEWAQGNALKYGKPLPPSATVNPDGSVSMPDGAASAGVASGEPIASGSLPRGIRNNNPGNLQFMGQAGAVPEPGSGRFARFGSMQQGIAALYRQIQLYKSRGINTLAKLAAKYAPPNENDTGAYLSQLVKSTGFGANSALDFSNPAVAESIIRGISRNENGGNYLPSGHFLVGARAGMKGGAQSNTTVSIGNVTIQTQATDAKSIARDFKSEIVAQANSGIR